MSAGLPRRLIPVFVGQGIDTKINPALMPAGELLEVENMYYQQTGKLQLRNGFAKQPVGTSGIASGDNLFATPQGGLMMIGRGAATSFGQPIALKYNPGTVQSQGWRPPMIDYANGLANCAYPFMTVRTTGVVGAVGSGDAFASDLADPDGAVAAEEAITSWMPTGSPASTKVPYNIYNAALGSLSLASYAIGSGSTPPRPGVCCVGGSSYLTMFYVDNAAPGSLKAVTNGTGLVNSAATVALNAVSVAQPWIDAKPIPGGNLIAVAYRATGGGVTCAIFNPATGAVTSSVNTAAADASFCLGFLDDALATGNMYLATAGSTSGVVVRTMSATTMVVSATNVVDNTATAGIRNITGHINSSSTNYIVLWDVNGSSTIYDRIKVGKWTGAATVIDLLPQHSLYSRSVKLADGRYYVLGAYDSTVQPAYSLLNTDQYGVTSELPVVVCTLAAGEGGGRRAVQCSLSSPYTSAGLGGVVIPFARRVKLTTASATAAQGRIISNAVFSSILTTLARPSELGGTLFIPGGIVNRDDGTATENVAFPFYPEAIALVSAAGGGMTASGVYLYRSVYKRQDATGRITRSASSVPVQIQLGAGDGNVTVTFAAPRVPLSEQAWQSIEHYRAGPAGTGAVNYNKVGESFYNGGAVDTLTFNDTMTDANAFLGELLYSTGNTLENFIPPSCNLLTVCGNRVWIVNAEDPTELWPSLEYKNRVGIRFNHGLAFKVTGDGAAGITALAAMDGRVIAFKGTAIYVISGAGPNDAGAGSFNPPQAISLTTGTLIPRSVVQTDDGIMFQSPRGIYLLDRGLTLTYVGAAVEQYTTAANVVDASLVTGTTQARFVMANGRCLVWDFFQKKWTTFLLRVGASTIVACANVPGDAWYYLLADGTLMKETPGVYSDVIGSSTAIVPRIGLPHLQFAKMLGFQRVYGCEIEGEYVGDHTLAVDVEYDFAGVVSETRTRAITVTAGSQFQYEMKVANQKSNAIKLTLRTSVQAAGSGAFRLSGVSFLVAVKGGSNIPYTKRLS